MAAAAPNDVERIKASSRNLRGTLVESLAAPLTGALAEQDTQLSKFHGIYQQDDRDVRSDRKRQKLEPAYSFMVRARVPGGYLTSAQWLALDSIANEYANGTIRLTTRQAVQFHGTIKQELKPTIAAINQAMLDTIAACGDVNRNVMAPALPELSVAHQQVEEIARSVSERLTPATRAYHEIWLDGEKLAASAPESEPLYGSSYLPRKFKMAFVMPPRNDVDIYSQDLGFVAIVEAGELVGFNVLAGGGLGMSHGEPATFPRLADVLGSIAPAQVVAAAEAVVTTQRDFGDRSDRKHARLKYTIEDRGLEWFKTEVESRLGFKLAAPKPFGFVGNGDTYGWQRDDTHRWHYTLFVENGRIADSGQRRLLSAMRELAAVHAGGLRLTPNQNLIITDVAPDARHSVDELLESYGVANDRQASALRLHSMACVALPTCGQAMAEGERYLPALIDKLDAINARLGLRDAPVTLRMTGCPNGCARPYIAEIGLVGKGPGRYNLYLGAGFAGNRLNALYRENADEKEILEALEPLLAAYSSERRTDERFGDFVLRSGLVREVTAGRNFHRESAR